MVGGDQHHVGVPNGGRWALVADHVAVQNLGQGIVGLERTGREFCESRDQSGGNRFLGHGGAGLVAQAQDRDPVGVVVHCDLQEFVNLLRVDFVGRAAEQGLRTSGVQHGSRIAWQAGSAEWCPGPQVLAPDAAIEPHGVQDDLRIGPVEALAQGPDLVRERNLGRQIAVDRQFGNFGIQEVHAGNGRPGVA